MGVELFSPDVAFMFATVRYRSQPSATVRKYARDVAMAVPMVSSAKRVTFGCFQRRWASFHMAGVALCDMSAFVVTCHKSLCVASAILLPGFSEDALHFSWPAQQFGDLRCHFAWHAQHFRGVVLPIFGESNEW